MEIIYKDNEKDLPEKKKRKKKKIKEVLLSQSEAQTYLTKTKKSYRLVGFGVWLILTGVSTIMFFNNGGIIFMFLAIAIAVMMFILSGNSVGDYEGLEEIPIRLDEQTYEIIEGQRNRSQLRNTFSIALGVALIILAVGAIAGFGLNPGFLLLIVGFSVFLFITSGGALSTYDHLLSRGDYQNYDTGRMLGQAIAPSAPEIPAATEPVLEHSTTVDNIDVNTIKKTGNSFISELYAAKNLIDNPKTLADIDEIIELTNKIIYRLEKEPQLIASTQRLFDYYLPMTVKLVVNYGEVKKQGISGENISSMIIKIENALSNLTIAYKSQLEKLYLHTSVDLEADISALEMMLKKEGLLSDGISDLGIGEHLPK